MNTVVVIGAGVAGMAAARELAGEAAKVVLVEKEARPGGWAGSYACKAAGGCQKCGACLAGQLAAELAGLPGLELLLGWQAVAIRELVPVGYAVAVQGGGGQREIEAAAVVVASGFRPFDAARWGEYGYHRYPGVVTSLDLDRAWREDGALGARYPGLERVAFIQCVGSRTTRPGGNPLCSRVCCRNTLRLVNRLLWELPAVRADVFHQDLQSEQSLIQTAAGNPRVQLLRTIPARVYQLPGWRLTVNWEDPATGREASGEYDLVVLAVGMNRRPAPETDGAEGKPLPGVIWAGAAAGPMDIRESIRRGRQAGRQVKRLLAENGTNR
ncbi:MAG: FAD-dependent oxidoreductase [Syntrophomonadaceae bacterium]|nr:FAD-dependent oxidoreductase [Syntrophomonadaceae bacterium]